MKPILIPLACASATYFMFTLIQFIHLLSFQEEKEMKRRISQSNENRLLVRLEGSNDCLRHQRPRRTLIRAVNGMNPELHG